MTRRGTVRALLAASAGLALGAAAASAQPVSTTATRPDKTPAAQTSVPADAPAASTTQTTGATNQGPVVGKMNRDEKAKVEVEGK